MGGTAYSATRSAVRTSSYSTQHRSEIFTSCGMDDDMNPKGLAFREARDSDVHPNSLPIVIALDVTGSMGYIPDELVKGGLAKIMGNIIQNGIPDPQILFLGIGDHECDRAPLQVGQFESGDEELDKWLTSVYLEGGGGGNGGESYLLAWYAAARYTKTDNWEKRGKKGLLFTIGDEPVLKNLPAKAQEVIMGNGQYETVTAEQLLKEVAEKWDIYHLHITETYSGNRKFVQDGWKQLLHDKCIMVDDHTHVPHIIARIVAESQGVQDVKLEDDVTAFSNTDEPEEAAPDEDSTKPIWEV